MEEREAQRWHGGHHTSDRHFVSGNHRRETILEQNLSLWQGRMAGDVLFHIFEFVGGITLFRIYRVCRLWRDVAKSPIILRAGLHSFNFNLPRHYSDKIVSGVDDVDFLTRVLKGYAQRVLFDRIPPEKAVASVPNPNYKPPVAKGSGKLARLKKKVQSNLPHPPKEINILRGTSIQVSATKPGTMIYFITSRVGGYSATIEKLYPQILHFADKLQNRIGWSHNGVRLPQLQRNNGTSPLFQVSLGKKIVSLPPQQAPQPQTITDKLFYKRAKRIQYFMNCLIADQALMTNSVHRFLGLPIVHYPLPKGFHTRYEHKVWKNFQGVLVRKGFDNWLHGSLVVGFLAKVAMTVDVSAWNKPPHVPVVDDYISQLKPLGDITLEEISLAFISHQVAQKVVFTANLKSDGHDVAFKFMTILGVFKGQRILFSYLATLELFDKHLPEFYFFVDNSRFKPVKMLPSLSTYNVYMSFKTDVGGRVPFIRINGGREGSNTEFDIIGAPILPTDYEPESEVEKLLCSQLKLYRPVFAKDNSVLPTVLVPGKELISVESLWPAGGSVSGAGVDASQEFRTQYKLK